MPRHSTETKWCAVALKKYTKLLDRDIAEKLKIKPREVQRIFARYKAYGDVKDRSGGDQKSLTKLGARYFLKKQKPNKNKNTNSEGGSSENSESVTQKEETHLSSFMHDVLPNTMNSEPPTPGSLTIYSPPLTPYQPSIPSNIFPHPFLVTGDITRSVERAGSVFVTPPVPLHTHKPQITMPTLSKNVVTTSLISSQSHNIVNTTSSNYTTIDVISCDIKTSPNTHTFQNNVVSVETVPMVASVQQNISSFNEADEKSLLNQVLLNNLNRKGIVACDISDKESENCKSRFSGSDRLSYDEDESDNERSEPETLPSTLIDDASDANLTTDDEDDDGIEDT